MLMNTVRSSIEPVEMLKAETLQEANLDRNAKHKGATSALNERDVSTKSPLKLIYDQDCRAGLLHKEG